MFLVLLRTLQSGWGGDVAPDNSVAILLANPIANIGNDTGTSGKSTNLGCVLDYFS